MKKQTHVHFSLSQRVFKISARIEWPNEHQAYYFFTLFQNAVSLFFFHFDGALENNENDVLLNIHQKVRINTAAAIVAAAAAPNTHTYFFFTNYVRKCGNFIICYVVIAVRLPKNKISFQIQFNVALF